MGGEGAGRGTAEAGANFDRAAATLALDEPASRVRLVSPQRARALEALGIASVRDLVTHYPRRYLDLSQVSTIADAAIGSELTIVADVFEVKLKKPKPRLSLTEITLTDATGTLIVTAFRQPWLADRIRAGERVAVAGKVEFDYGFKRMTNPFIEAVDGDGRGAAGGVAGRVVPIHPACEKVSAAMMRRLVANALDLVAGCRDPLPVGLRAKYRLMSRGRALAAIHFPETMAEAAEARRRLAYEELLVLELALMIGSQARAAEARPTAHDVDGARVRAFSAALPFSLTEDQARARDDVFAELSADRCANHLVLGDVGTGKTVIAAFALAAASDSGTQALMLAPTEVLARQHADSLGRLFDAVGVTWELLVGSTPEAERAAVLDRAAAGTVDVLIGTHALLEPDVRLARCSLVVIDEQQRFGVAQREAALAKGEAPDALYLTATPIPRTLALAVFGDLTLSYLTQRPRAAAPRTTKVLRRDERGFAYDAARAAVARGERVYIVCPLVGERGGAEREGTDAKAADAGRDEGRPPRERIGEERYEYASIRIEDDADFDAGGSVAAAEQEAAVLQRSLFSDVGVELLHGRLSAAEKRAVMERFRSGASSVLVATTVIEVGVDVPDATVMIVEDADRFGLSQLHQLRGRVGRGEKPGEVYLVSSSRSPVALERLQAMERTDDGFELASYDLSLRREGDILGNRQHGASSLKLVNVVRDRAIVEAAHADAASLLANDPTLSDPCHRALAREARLAAGDGVKRGG